MPKRRHTEEERSVLAHDWLELAEHRSEIADEKLPEDRPDLLVSRRGDLASELPVLLVGYGCLPAYRGIMLAAERKRLKR